MIVEEIRAALREQAEPVYRQFHGGLVPDRDNENLLGVRVPVLRKMAREYAKREDVGAFLNDLPHRYYEENAVHSFIVEQIKSFDSCMTETERFLPYIDNWGVCDCFSPKVFGKHKPELFARCEVWLQSEHTYTVRYGLVMLLKHFLTEDYTAQALALAGAVDSEEYYIRMAQAWLFAEAVGKCPEEAVPYLEARQLPVWVHNKAIQKSIESRRVPMETKDYLRTLKIK